MSRRWCIRLKAGAKTFLSSSRFPRGIKKAEREGRRERRTELSRLTPPYSRLCKPYVGLASQCKEYRRQTEKKNLGNLIKKRQAGSASEKKKISEEWKREGSGRHWLRRIKIGFQPPNEQRCASYLRVRTAGVPPRAYFPRLDAGLKKRKAHAYVQVKGL